MSKRSFTVTEILIAFTIFSVIAGFMYTILSKGFSDTDERLVSFTRMKFDSLVKSLKKDLRSIYSTDSFEFSRESRSFKFTIARLSNRKLPEKVQITYTWKQNNVVKRIAGKTEYSAGNTRTFDFGKLVKTNEGEFLLSFQMKTSGRVKLKGKLYNREKKLLDIFQQQFAISVK